MGAGRKRLVHGRRQRGRAHDAVGKRDAVSDSGARRRHAGHHRRTGRRALVRRRQPEPHRPLHHVGLDHAVSAARPPGSGPNGITVGPDGALWFTENAGNRIGRRADDGTFTEFTIPTASSGPKGIVTGSDGNLWFTENNKNQIGRLTTAGVFTEFPIPTASAHPEGIAAGADGNLWFVENNGHNVGRITLDGTITEFPLPVATRVFRIAGGPDGNLWFPEFDTNRVGRMSTGGALTEFLVPTATSGPYGIVAGTDRNLWFSEFKEAKIGRVGVGLPSLSTSGLSPTSGPASGGVAASLSSGDAPADATVRRRPRAGAAGIGLFGNGHVHRAWRCRPASLYDVVVTDPATGAFGRIDGGVARGLHGRAAVPRIPRLRRDALPARGHGGVRERRLLPRTRR